MSTLRVDNIKSRTGTAVSISDGNSIIVGGGMTVTGSLDVTGGGSINNPTGVATYQTLDGALLGTFAGDTSVGGALTVTGNLTVKGTETIINTTSLEVRDKTVGVGSTASPTDTTGNQCGLVVYGAPEKKLLWNSSGTKWSFSGGGLDVVDLNISGVSTAGVYYGRAAQVPQNVQGGTYSLVATDAGKHILASNTVTVDQNLFAVGDAISIYNNTAGNITITQGTGVTLRLAGTSTTGSRTLALRGIMTLLCVNSNEFVCSGTGLT